MLIVGHQLLIMPESHRDHCLQEVHKFERMRFRGEVEVHTLQSMDSVNFQPKNRPALLSACIGECSASSTALAHSDCCFVFMMWATLHQVMLVPDLPIKPFFRFMDPSLLMLEQPAHDVWESIMRRLQADWNSSDSSAGTVQGIAACCLGE